MKEIIEIAGRKGLKEVEVFYQDSSSQEVSFENNNLKNISASQNSGIGIRGVNNGKIGVCSFTHMEDAESAIDKLIESSQFSDPKEFEFSKPGTYSKPKIYDSSVEKVSIDKLVADGEKIIEKIKQYDKDVLANVSFQVDTETTRINNSFGVEGEYKKSSFMAYVSGQVIDGTSFIETDSYRYGLDVSYDIDKIVETFIERMKYSRRESKIESGVMNVLFSPNAFKHILSTVNQGVNGNAIEKGISPLKDRIGEKIFDERFSLIDDATLDNHVASQPFDDEGIPTRRNLIFENGVLKGYIHSLRTAAKTKSEPTGNGNRGTYDSLPAPSFNNMIIQPGTMSFEEMLETMGDGIIIDEILGLEMNNLLNGDFGGNVQMGFKVSKGKIEGRIKNAVFNSNIYKILKDDLIGISDLKYTHPLVRNVFAEKVQPCALFKGMNIIIK